MILKMFIGRVLENRIYFLCFLASFDNTWQSNTYFLRTIYYTVLQMLMVYCFVTLSQQAEALQEVIALTSKTNY